MASAGPPFLVERAEPEAVKEWVMKHGTRGAAGIAPLHVMDATSADFPEDWYERQPDGSYWPATTTTAKRISDWYIAKDKEAEAYENILLARIAPGIFEITSMLKDIRIAAEWDAELADMYESITVGGVMQECGGEVEPSARLREMHEHALALYRERMK